MPRSRNVNIRLPKIADIQALLCIEQTCFTAHRFDKKQFKYYVHNPLSIFFVAETKRRLVGYACGILDHRQRIRTARLYSMAVLPEMRDIGVGAMLLRQFEKEATRRNCESVTLEVHEKNAAAVALYKSFNYICERDLPDYYGSGQNGLRMRKILRRKEE